MRRFVTYNILHDTIINLNVKERLDEFDDFFVWSLLLRLALSIMSV